LICARRRSASRPTSFDGGRRDLGLTLSPEPIEELAHEEPLHQPQGVAPDEASDETRQRPASWRGRAGPRRDLVVEDPFEPLQAHARPSQARGLDHASHHRLHEGVQPPLDLGQCPAQGGRDGERRAGGRPQPGPDRHLETRQQLRAEPTARAEGGPVEGQATDGEQDGAETGPARRPPGRRRHRRGEGWPTVGIGHDGAISTSGPRGCQGGPKLVYG